MIQACHRAVAVASKVKASLLMVNSTTENTNIKFTKFCDSSIPIFREWSARRFEWNPRRKLEIPNPRISAKWDTIKIGDRWIAFFYKLDIRVLRGRNNYEQPWFDLWWCLQAAKKLCEDLHFFRISRDFLTVNTYFLTWIQISASEAGSKNWSKKKSFFLFLFSNHFPTSCTYPESILTFTGFSKLKRKKFVRMCDFDWIVDCKYALFWGGYQISAKRGTSKNRSKKKSFFLFCSPTISRQAVVIRKAIRPVPPSLSRSEKSLCGSVILTGFFDCK